MTSSTDPRIAIIGAGPAGLTLGLLLHLEGIPFTIYDLRSKPTEEEFAQSSGSLDLHEDTGLAAVRACNLYDEFVTLTGECSEADVVANKEGTILHADEGNGNRPEISRHALTKMLLSRIPEECIRWENKLLTVTPGEDGGYQLDFGNKHDLQTVDLVIGADGAWSRVRSLLTDQKPHYSGVHFITITISELDSRHPHLGKFVGSGSFTAPGDHNIVMCQRGTKGSARIYLAVSTAEEELASKSGLNTASPMEAKNIILGETGPDTKWKFFGSFAPILQELITRGLEETAGVLDIKPLYMLPVDQLAWKHRAGATLIGDAAHLMTPFAGEGVNLAMRDALDLSNTIKGVWNGISNGNLRDRAFREALNEPMALFEKELFERAEEIAKETENNMKLFTSENAAEEWAGMLQQFMAMPHPE